MSIVSPPLPASHGVRQHRLISIWLDGIERGWGVPVMLALFAAAWMLTLTFAYWNVSPHPDVLEAWLVGRTPGWGNAKHPPLMGWLAHVWTMVFPVANWSMALLAMVNAAAALWIVDLIARRFLKAEGRAIVLLLAMLLPAYHFHAQRFNANSVLLPLWPLAIYCFLRSFEDRRSIGWAAAAGAASALAVMGKYYSVFLIASFVFAAVVHPRRMAYFRSPAPWTSAIVGLAALAPHLYWLVTTDFLIFKYPVSRHGGLGLAEVAEKSVKFAAGIAAWLAIPAIVWCLMLRTDRRAWLDGIRNHDDRFTLLALVFAGTIVFPVLAAIAVRSSLPSVWALQGLFLAIVLVVVASPVLPHRSETVKLTYRIAGLTLLIAVLSPLHSIYRNTHPFNEGRNFYLPATEELMRQWQSISSQPLRRASGEESLAFAIAFYSKDHPVFSRPVLPHGELPLPPPSVLQGGWASLCFVDQPACVDWQSRVAARASNPIFFQKMLTTELWGMTGAARAISGLMVPPAEVTPKPRVPSPLLHEDGIEEFSARGRR